MLVACRLAGLSAFEGHYASLIAFAQCRPPADVRYLFSSARYAAAPMPDAPERLTPTTADDVADALMSTKGDTKN